MPVTAKFDLGFLGFSSIPTIRPSRTSATPNRSASGTSLSRIFAPLSCASKVFGHVGGCCVSMMLSPRMTQMLRRRQSARPSPARRRCRLRLPDKCSPGASGRTPCRWPAGAGSRRNCGRRSRPGSPGCPHPPGSGWGSRSWACRRSGSRCLLVILVRGNMRLPVPPGQNDALHSVLPSNVCRLQAGPLI